LRPAQQFDIGNVVEIVADHALTAGVDAVDENAHRTVDAIGVEAVVADAANAKIELLGIGQIDRERRKAGLKSVQKLTVLLGELPAAERGDRNGHRLRVFGPLARINDNVGHLAGCGIILLPRLRGTAGASAWAVPAMARARNETSPS
jgi:hypothetical protein